MTAPHDPYGQPDDDPRRSGEGSGAPSSGAPQHGQPYAQPHQPYGHDPHWQQQPQQPGWGPQQPQQPYGQPTYGRPQPPPYGAGVGPGGYGAPPPKKSGVGKIIGIVAAVLVGLCVLGGIATALTGGGDDGTDTAAAPTSGPAETPEQSRAAEPAAPAPSEQPAEDDKLTFKVTGDGSAMLTWIDGSFQTSQETAPLPWTKSIADEGTPGVNVVAQKKSGDDSKISCQILRGDEVVTENSSSGPYAVVTCVLK